MRHVILFASAVLTLAVLIALSVDGLPRLVPRSPLSGRTAGTSASTSFRAATMLAARYRLRNRSKTFFERAARPPSAAATTCSPSPPKFSAALLTRTMDIGLGRGEPAPSRSRQQERPVNSLGANVESRYGSRA